MGLVLLFVFLLCFAGLAGAPVLAYGFTRSIGWRTSSSRWSALTAFLLVYTPVFWDWMPVLWTHSRHCEKESGLFVYQTPRHWMEANPGIADTLAAQRPVIHGTRDQHYIQLNERIRWEMDHVVLPLWNRKREDRIVDVQTGQVLVRRVDFATGDGGTLNSLRDFKIWMKRMSCEPGEPPGARAREFNLIQQEFGALGAKR